MGIHVQIKNCLAKCEINFLDFIHKAREACVVIVIIAATVSVHISTYPFRIFVPQREGQAPRTKFLSRGQYPRRKALKSTERVSTA